MLIRNTYARRRVSIVLYHDPSPEHFARHLAYYAKHFTFATLSQLSDALACGSWSCLPTKALVITFDDGHKGNYRLLPLFRQYNVRPTIFLVSRVIRTNRHFWFCHDGVDSNKIKALSNERRLAALEAQHGFTLIREYSPEDRHALSAEEIAEMAPYVDFQAHTCFHPVLPTCTDEESRREIVQCKSDLEAVLGRPCCAFSYPNGDYGEREVRYVREAGYSCARTIDVGWNGPESDPYRLKIVGVTDDASVNILAAQLSGISMYVKYRLRGGRGGRWPQVRVNESGP